MYYRAIPIRYSAVVSYYGSKVTNSEEDKNMNKYGAIWKELSVEVMADTTYAAQGLALPLLQAKAGRRKVKQYDITVALMQLKGVDYIHVAS